MTIIDLGIGVDEYTPEQKQALEGINEKELQWCFKHIDQWKTCTIPGAISDNQKEDIKKRLYFLCCVITRDWEYEAKHNVTRFDILSQLG